MRRSTGSAASTPVEVAYRVLRDRLVQPTPAVPQTLEFDVVAIEFALDRRAIEMIFDRLVADGLGLLAGLAGLIAWTPERRELADAYAIRATLDETAARRAADLIEPPEIRRLQFVMLTLAVRRDVT